LNDEQNPTAPLAVKHGLPSPSASFQVVLMYGKKIWRGNRGAAAEKQNRKIDNPFNEQLFSLYLCLSPPFLCFSLDPIKIGMRNA
jgi:hypothetical protein